MSLLLAAICLALTGPSAHAQNPEARVSTESAEQVRLDEDMRRLASRGLWDGVERSYLELVYLSTHGVVVTADQHDLGAEAARNRGDAQGAHERLLRAQEVSPTAARGIDVADLEGRFGEVHLLSRAKRDKAVLSVTDLPFAPDERAAVLFAQNELAAKGQFKGYLPRLAYSFAGENFTVVPGQVPVVIEVSALPEGEGAQTRRSGSISQARAPLRGPIITVGPAWTWAAATDNSEVQPEPFSGPGARVGAGLDLGTTNPLSVPIVIGYQSLYGVPPGGGELPDRAHFGWVQASLAIHTRTMRFAIGPELALGFASSTGLRTDPAPVWCEEPNTPAEVCTDAALARTAVRGTLRSGGIVGGYTWWGASSKTWQAGPTLEGGFLHDGARVWPWLSLGFTVQPQRFR
jgi:hypothetical protein